MHVEKNNKAHAGNGCHYGLRPCGVLRRACAGRYAVYPFGQVPCRGRAKRNAKRAEQHLHNADYAGVCVAVYYIAHGIGYKKPGHQYHKRAYYYRVNVVHRAKPRRGICRHGKQERRGNGAEKRVGFPFVHKPRHKARYKPQKSRKQAVLQRAAENGAEARRHEEMAQIEYKR